MSCECADFYDLNFTTKIWVLHVQSFTVIKWADGDDDYDDDNQKYGNDRNDD